MILEVTKRKYYIKVYLFLKLKIKFRIKKKLEENFLHSKSFYYHETKEFGDKSKK